MKRSVKLRSVLFIASLLALAPAARAQWVAFNDQRAGPGTHPNATQYDAWISYWAYSGQLRDVATGRMLPACLEIGGSAVVLETQRANPALGTPLSSVFQGFVDFGSGLREGAYLKGASDQAFYAFSGLNPGIRYRLRGGACSLLVGGNTNCWTLVSLEGAETFTNAHSPGVVVKSQMPALAANQALVSFGNNDATNRGDMVGWDEIAPGPDGRFVVVCAAYQGGGSGAFTSFILTGLRLSTDNPDPVYVTTNPVPQAVIEGQAAAFRIDAIGGPLFYQWCRNGEPLAGATEPVLSFSHARLEDAGTYCVVVTNATSAVTNCDAVLGVTAPRPMAVTTQPADCAASNGATVRFSPGVDGVPAGAWQWHKDGMAILCATNAELVISNLTPSDAGVYCLRGTNPASWTASSNAILTVRGWPEGAPGAVDTNFIGSCGTWVRAIAVESNGAVYIGGALTNMGGLGGGGLLRINAYGRVDESFVPGTNCSPAYAVAVQPDGKVLVGCTSISRSVARFEINGTLDLTFMPPGTASHRTIRQIVLQRDGKLLVAGEFTEWGGASRNRLARLNSNGSLDTTFDPGTGADNTVRALALLEEGWMLVGGLFNKYNGVTRPWLARVTSNGVLDPFFPVGAGPNGAVYYLKVSGNRILMAGDFTTVNGVPMNRVARLNLDGSLDATFQPGGGAVGGPVYTITELEYGQLMIGGVFTSVDGTPLNGLARLNADGSLDRTFLPAPGADGWVLVSAAVPGNGVLIGGLFTTVNGLSQPFLTRLVGRGGPFLKLERTAEGPARLLWHTNAPGFVLQSRAALGTGEWLDEPGAPEVSGEWNTLNVSSNSVSGFYRLLKR